MEGTASLAASAGWHEWSGSQASALAAAEQHLAARFKEVDEDGFWVSCRPLCRSSGAQPGTGAQFSAAGAPAFGGDAGWIAAGWRGEGNRGVRYSLNLPFWGPSSAYLVTTLCSKVLTNGLVSVPTK